jgi:hypothetical protein
MYLETTRIDRPNAHPLSSTSWSYEDPVDPDAPGDDVIVTTKRGLCRVAIVAAEVGGRFQREGISLDPMGWMLSPRDLFRGGAAIEACLDRTNFMRATLLHGLSLGADADPEEIDELLADEEGPDRIDDGLDDDGSAPLDDMVDGAVGLKLFSGVIIHYEDHVALHVFHASLAWKAGDVLNVLVERHGPEIAAKARIVAGVDSTDPNVSDLVSPATIRLLRQIERDPEAAFAEGLSINIEQRFDS